MNPRGTAVIIGGSEDKGEQNETKSLNNEYEQFEILKELLPADNKSNIVIITTASDVPEEMEQMYREAFEKMGFPNIDFAHIKNKLEARETQFCERVRKAHAVLFSGGDQFRLVATLGGAETIAAIREKYLHDENFVVAGTSAGAMAMSNIMIYEGGVHEAILKGDLKLAGGFGIIDNFIVDTHFVKRGRFGRLAHAVTMNPDTLGIGLGEDTAVIIRNGIGECKGSGMVVLLNGDEIDETNIADAADGSPVFVENLKMHLLAKGSQFSMKKRQPLKRA